MRIECFTRREFDVVAAVVFCLVILGLTFGGLSFVLVLLGVGKGVADLASIVLIGLVYMAIKHRPYLLEYAIPAASLALLKRFGCEVAFREN